ncbi:MAG: hypothetical protein ABIL09_21400 [Gemmatimonadota bacterium]
MSLRLLTAQALKAALAVALLSLPACGPSEEEVLLAQFQEDLAVANTTIDSLNYTVESSNLLIDEMRARVDSLQHVDAKLLASVQRLNQEVKEWRELAAEQKRQNNQLNTEIERMKREKQTDQRTIAALRSQSDSLNTSLLQAHTNIRRQEDHIRRMEVDLGQARDDLTQMRLAESSVRVYAATEAFLDESGYLESSRGMGRAFRKSYKLVQRLEPTDSRVQLAAIGQPLRLEGKLKTIVDRYGELKKGDAYSVKKGDGGVEITFKDEMLAGVDVLAVMEE